MLPFSSFQKPCVKHIFALNPFIVQKKVVYLQPKGMKEDVRKQLFRKLKKENCFWSYDVSKMKSISDEALIEHVLLYLDIEDIDKLFPLFGYMKVKRVWLDRVAPLGPKFRQYNILYAWYYFGAKRPEAYVKSIETRHVNRITGAGSKGE